MAKTTVMLQARIASSRLPEKALLELAGVPVLVHAMRALREVPVDGYLLLTDQASAPRFEPLARAEGFEMFVGAPRNVLKRYCDACRETGADRFIRATGDNPLVSPTAARLALALSEASHADYAGILETPYGTGVEVVRSRSLLDGAASATSAHEKEHVTPMFYENAERWHIELRPAPSALRAPDLRVTLDTHEDYAFLSTVFRDLYRGSPIEIPELVEYAVVHQQTSA